MKFSCDREKVLSAFQAAAAVCPARTPKPILMNVKVDVSADSVTFSATDLEVGIRTLAPVMSVDAPGSIVAPASLLLSILRELSDPVVHFEAGDDQLRVRGDRSEFKLSTAKVEEFPEPPLVQESKHHQVPARLVKELIRRTIFATDAESSRYALGGVLLEMTPGKIIAVGTDGRRLSTMEGAGESIGGHDTSDKTVIVPARAMQLIERSLGDLSGEVELTARANDLHVKTPTASIYTRLVEGRFPRWRDVFPAATAGVFVDIPVGLFHAAVRQATILTSDKSRGVDFNFAAGNLLLTNRATELGQSRIEVPIAFDADPTSIRLDPRYVADFLRVLDPDKNVRLQLQGPEAALVLGAEDGYRYVVMPLAQDK